MLVGAVLICAGDDHMDGWLSSRVTGREAGEIGRILMSENGLAEQGAVSVPLACSGDWWTARNPFVCPRCTAVRLYRLSLTSACPAWVADVLLFVARHFPYQYIHL